MSNGQQTTTQAPPESTPTPSPTPPAGEQPTATGTQDENSWSLFAHLSTLTIILGGIFTFVGPLVIYLVGKDKGPTVEANAKEALNFGITISGLFLIGYVLMIVLIGFLVMIAAFVVWLVFMIQAVMAANKGEMYTYPMSIRFVK